MKRKELTALLLAVSVTLAGCGGAAAPGVGILNESLAPYSNAEGDQSFKGDWSLP